MPKSVGGMVNMDKARRRLVSGGFAVAAALLGRQRGGGQALSSQTGAAPSASSYPPIAASAAIARLTDVDLWYWDSGGDGAPIILLHPATGSGHVWAYQYDAFRSAGHRVIGYSRRGFRGSGSGDPAKPGTAAQDLCGLMDHLRLPWAHVVGSAAGAFVAASFALMWPQRLRSLTLACSILSPQERAVTDMLPFLREPWFNALPHEFRELSPTYRAMNPQGVAHWKMLNAQSRGDNPPINQPLGDPAMIGALRRLTMPVLLISGDADLIAPPPVARLFHKVIRGSELVVLAECGHSAYWEQPASFNAAVLGFVSRCGTG